MEQAQNLGPAARRALQAACTSRVNVTFSGGDLPGIAARVKGVQSASECCARCRALAACFAWTWSSRTKICYGKRARGWEASLLGGVVSGQVDRAPPPAAAPPPPPAVRQPWWAPRLTVGDDQLTTGFADEIKVSSGANNKRVVRDPTGSNTFLPVLKATYNKGCWSPSEDCGGGALFYAWPHGREASIGDAVRLEYEVFFPIDFPWVKGGKLPGLLGGDTGCSGGASAEDCFSVRLNDVGHANGLVQVDIDNALKIHYHKLRWRNRADVDIDAFVFSTWFGGSDGSWAPPRTVDSYFRNIKMYRL